MSSVDRFKYMILNKAVMGKKFTKKDPDDYIYASLTQPPVKVINRNGTDDEMDWTVECPNCHRHVNFGHQLFMCAGRFYCDDEKCRKDVVTRYAKEKELSNA